LSKHVNVEAKLNNVGSVRKVIYRIEGVLTSKIVQESVSSILESLARSDLEGAKRKLQAIAPDVRNEKERGSLFAATGIYASMTKGKEGTMRSWDSDRIERAAGTITSSQLSDEFDLGYAETLLSYSKLTQKSQQPAA
jgi:hypothetical protein